MKLYNYVGPEELLELIKVHSQGDLIESDEDVRRWYENTGQQLDANGVVKATFVINSEGKILLSDRHSEHVVCAAGKKVLSAGEIGFSIQGKSVEVVYISNQSTGYCPEPESWEEVEKTLCKTNMDYPIKFNNEFVFRKCTHCEAISIVKEGWFKCAECNSELDVIWNVD